MWPQIARGGVWSVAGGMEYDGRVIMPLDEAAIRQVAREMRASGLHARWRFPPFFRRLIRVMSSARARFSPRKSPTSCITYSSELGRIGLLERENAALLNAALSELAHDTIRAFEQAIRDSGLHVPPSTLPKMTAPWRRPRRRCVFPSIALPRGPPIRCAGAAYLSGLDDAMVIDVGGTTTDVGQLKLGFPRESNSVVQIGGVRTLFRMPDLLSFGLGGGSQVGLDPVTCRAGIRGLSSGTRGVDFWRATTHRNRCRGSRGSA